MRLIFTMISTKEKNKISKKTGLKKFIKNKQVNLVIKLLVAVLVILVIYRQIIVRENIDELWATFLQHFNYENLPYLVFTILLMPVNWIFETLKWQMLIQKFEQLSFFKTFKAILAGVTFAIFTPNRVGEYGGRVLFVKAENNWKAVIATAVGSLSQLLVLLSMGLLGLAYFTHQFIVLDPYVLRSMVFLGLISISILLFSFFNIDLVIPLIKRLAFAKYIKRFIKDISLLKEYTSKELIRALGFSLVRYFVYSLQYYLLLQFFGIEVGILAAFAGIATIYLIQTSLPIMPILGLLARVEIALYIWGNFSENDISILASTFGLWVINLIIPSLIGMAFITNVNILKSLGYESK